MHKVICPIPYENASRRELRNPWNMHPLLAKWCVSPIIQDRRAISDVAIEGQGGRVPPWQRKKYPPPKKKEGENQEQDEKEEKSGRFFHFAPPDR